MTRIYSILVVMVVMASEFSAYVDAAEKKDSQMVKRRSKLQKEHWERVRVLNRRYQKSDSDEEGPTVEEGAHPEVESSYTVKMTNFGKNKIEVLKVVRRLLKLGVKEANELV
eukprot:470185_1